MLHIDQLRKDCISYKDESKLVLEPCKIGDKKTLSNLKNPKRIVFAVDKNGYLKKIEETNIKG